MKQILVWVLLFSLMTAGCKQIFGEKKSVLRQSDSEMITQVFINYAEPEELISGLQKEDPDAQAQLEQLRRDGADELLKWLMRQFSSGSLRDCQLDDNSCGAVQFRVWQSFLGMESIESVLESPQQYWDDWSGRAKRIYELNGIDFLREQGYSMSELYAEILNEKNDGVG